MLEDLLDDYNKDEDFVDIDKEEHSEKKTRMYYPRPNYWDSCWGRMLTRGDFSKDDTRDSKIFRRRFRVPHTLFLALLSYTKEWFPQDSQRNKYK